MHEWVKIRSWHIVKTWTRVPGRAITYCNHRVEDAHAVERPPDDEKTCETCFRRREGLTL